MIGLIARLSRSIPLVIALILLAVIVYFIVKWRRSPTAAKEVLIKMFLVICGIIAVFFGLVSAYAAIEGNTAVLELALSFAGVGVIGLIIVLICRRNFLKHHPHYRFKVTSNAKPPEGTQTVEDAPITRGGMFWKLYDLLGIFRPKG